MYEHNTLGYRSSLALCLTKVRSSRACCPATALIRNETNIKKRVPQCFTREQNGHNFERFSIYECVVDNFIFLLLTHLSLVSLLWDIGKQYSPRCDAAERGVPSGAILFAQTNFIEK